MALKMCKECGTEVSSKGVCPKCGKDQRNFFVKHKVITFLLIVIIIGAVSAAIGEQNSLNTSSSNITINNNTNKITLDKFNKIETGMTYQQVKDIIGEDGTVLSEADMGFGEEYHTIIYVWTASNGIANANVTFQGGKVVGKAQVGL